ncbi:Elongation factor 1-gamma [Armadillidium vulgare]|nr:Elongation factor 1-gamma [Armadillidium vulgare]
MLIPFLNSSNILSLPILYTYPENFRAYKALIAAQYSGAQVTTDPSFNFGETNKTEAFLKKFPLGKVPAFETSNGEGIFESNAISWAVANEQLRGTSPLQQAHIIQWMNFADNEILPASCTWVFPCLGIMPFNKSNTERAKEDVKKYVLEPSFREPYINTNRWFMTMINQPQVKAVIGDFKLCEKMAQFDGKKFAEMQGKLDKRSGGASEKKEKKQAKEEKKESAPKKVVEEEAPAPAAPKTKDPLDALPAGTLVMDEWKRFYSNNEEAKSVPWFWENFDKEHYSIWFCEYKYAEELTKIFMTCNLVGGMFQRLDKMRKNAFASMCVFGEDNNNNISGIWVWRGHELAFPLSEDWTIDYESYDWKKLDPDSEETKKLVDQYFKWEGSDSKGRKFNQGKIFK